MIRRPPYSLRADTLCSYSTLFRTLAATGPAVPGPAYLGVALYLFRSALRPMVADAYRPHLEQRLRMGTQPLRSTGTFLLWVAAGLPHPRVFFTYRRSARFLDRKSVV